MFGSIPFKFIVDRQSFYAHKNHIFRYSKPLEALMESPIEEEQGYAILEEVTPDTCQAYTSICRHDGWWSKVQGRTECPKCDEIWTYLLQCPGCQMKACPRYQAAIRPRILRNAARTNRRTPPRVRTPSPDFNFDYGW